MKNLDRRHGGLGTSLTLNGRQQMSMFCDHGFITSRMFESIYFVDRPQCRESAQIIANNLRCNLRAVSGLLPFNLGILDGLSDSDVEKFYPELAKVMNRWRAGQIEICDLGIPNATEPFGFFSSVSNEIKKLTQMHAATLLIGTRSILLAGASFLLGRHPSSGGGYREIIWNNAAWLMFKFEDGKSELVHCEGVNPFQYES